MTFDTTTDELTVLRALGLKGRADVAVLAGVTGLDETRVRTVLVTAVGREEAKEKDDRFRIAAPGRERLGVLLAEARAGVDQAAAEELYERFHAPNTEIKELMTAWQMRDGAPNDHGDRAYDDGVAAQIAVHHAQVEGLVAEIAALADHLGSYPRRLREAAQRVGAGDHDHIAKPLIDSYHTVWFELHEDLIALLGRTRLAEAEAGRAL